MERHQKKTVFIFYVQKIWIQKCQQRNAIISLNKYLMTLCGLQQSYLLLISSDGIYSINCRLAIKVQTQSYQRQILRFIFPSENIEFHIICLFSQNIVKQKYQILILFILNKFSNFLNKSNDLQQADSIKGNFFFYFFIIYITLNIMFSGFAIRRFFGGLKFTKSHQWIQFFPESKTARVGISNHAQDQLGQIIHVQFPHIGVQFEENASAAVIESVKIAADVYTPIAGTVTAINSEVGKNPTLVNQQAEKSWLFEINYTSQPKGLLNLQEYKKVLQNEKH